MGSSRAYPLNPMYGDIAVPYQQYQNNIYDYHLVKELNSSHKKIFVADIDAQFIKEEKYMVVGYANK